MARWWLAAVVWCCVGTSAFAAKIVLDDGRILDGELVRVATMANFKSAPPPDGAPVVRMIVVCDDGLRRFYVPARRVKNIIEVDSAEVLERFELKQPTHGKAGRIASLGPIIKITPFDEHGRRIFTMATERGPLDVIQGIRFITPRWTQVEGLNYDWEMRIATSSIPKETLKRMLARVIDAKNPDHRVKLVRFDIQMKTYNDAAGELDGVLTDFPDMANKLEPFRRSLTQLNAQRLLDEIRMRADAGQHGLAYRSLSQFPVDGVSGEILQSVRGLKEEYETENERALRARQLFDDLMLKLADDDRRRVMPARDEIFARRAELAPEDVTNWLTFCSTLGQQMLTMENTPEGKPRAIPSPGRRIAELFDDNERQILAKIAQTAEMTPEQNLAMFFAVRDALRINDMYRAEDFASVQLTSEAKLLLQRDLKTLAPNEALRLNRLLLESAYPDLVVRSYFTGLTINTLVHLEAFLQFADQKNLAPGDKPLSSEEKLSLAVSGWVLGSNSSVPNLSVALSLWRIRGLVREYMKEPLKLRRDQLLNDIQQQEGASPENIAKVLNNLPPPVATEPQQIPGFFELDIPSNDNGPSVKYFVQLPPEYDPHGRYSTIVSLHGIGSVAAHSVVNPPTPEERSKPSMIDWWAGSPDENGWRSGQSMRNGYIVIAPAWARPTQKEYEYSSREHDIVLSALRDACRRFAVDTDRVYLSGHSMGGDAVWDIGLAHPDLWAGVIPVVGVSNKYCALYWENAEHVPFYVVGGELDGDNSIRNARDIDRYMTRYFDITVAEFRGRGHEHFSDEILNLFDWMKNRKRNFHNKDFSVRSIRSWDNYFWWTEFHGYPERATANSWPATNKRPLLIQGKIVSTPGPNGLNNIRISSGANLTTVWLSPQLIDFNLRTIVMVDGKRINPGPFIKPEISVILEDARTRGDRQRPFWARLDSR